MRHKARELIVIVLTWIVLLSGCSMLFGTSTRENLPGEGKWKYEGADVIVDFDSGIYEIDGVVYELTLSSPDFLDCGIRGYCVEVNDEAFAIQSTKNTEVFWFYRTE